MTRTGEPASWSTRAQRYRATAPPLGGRPARVVRDHPARLPVPGEHHVGGRRPPARRLRHQSDPPRVGGYGARPRRPWPRPANRNPTICGESGTTWSSGAGLVAVLSVRRARATPAFTNRTSFVSPSWFVLPRRTGSRIRGVHPVRPGSRGPGYAWRGFRMSKQPGNLNAVFGRFRRRMLAAKLSTGAVERRDIGNASEPARRTMLATPPDSPPRLPVRALGEYVPGGRVDAMRRLLRGR